MNDPRMERELQEFLKWAREDRAEGITLKALHVRLEAIAQERKADKERYDRKLARHHERIARLENPHRPPQASIDPDDSGSIDLHALGGRVRLTGRTPMRLAAFLVLGALLVGATALVTYLAVARPTIQPTQPAEREPRP